MIMDYEKKYNDALNTAKMWYKNTAMPDNVKEIMRRIFPELQESEDERIRNQLLNWFKECHWDSIDNDKTPLKREDIIAWLEKQGQVKESAISQHDNTTCKENDNSLTQGKSALEATKEAKVDNANKVEPKFDVDDWVVRKDGKNFADGRKTVRITRFDGERYWFDCGTYLQAEDIRLWTIADAKAGDVLASDNSVFIFQREYIAGKPTAYCGIMNGCFVQGLLGCWTNEQCYPATKEQEVSLFQKMKEAGYEWDGEKLELKKRIE